MTICKNKETAQSTYEVDVDEEKRLGCGGSVEVCLVQVYELRDEKSVPGNTEQRIGSESCIEVCEQETITVTQADC